MKRSTWLILIVLLLVVVAAAIAVILTRINRDDIEQRVEPSDAVVLYFNAKQLYEKGAFENYINEEQRKLLSTVAGANLTNHEQRALIQEIAFDINASGVNFNVPMYAYVNSKEQSPTAIILVAEVSNIAQVDKTMELISTSLELSNEGILNIEHQGENRIFSYMGHYGGYNNTRLVLAVTLDDSDPMIHVTEALSRPLIKYNTFGKRDIAAFIELNKTLDILEKMLASDIERSRAELAELEYEDPWIEENIINDEKQLETFRKLRTDIPAGACLTTGLTFELGKIVWDFESTGVDIDTEKYGIMRVNNNHLNYIDKEAIALFNFGLNGEKCVLWVNELFNSLYNALYGIDRNTYNMVAAITTDALKSINGDITIALEDITGTEYSYYNYHTGRYTTKAELESAKAIAMVDVTDSYIYSNVAQFTYGTLTPVGDKQLYANLNGEEVFFGEENGILYAGLNSSLHSPEVNATDTRWLTDVEDGYGYIILDIKRLMQSSYIASEYKAIKQDMNNIDAMLLDRIVDMSDYAYMNIDSTNSSEYVVVLTDSNTNALKQLADNIMPLFISEIMSGIL